MKVRVHWWRITWRYLLVTLIVAIIMFAAFFYLFLSIDQTTGEVKWISFGAPQIIVLVFTFGFLVFGYISSLRSYYYVIEDKYFIMKRLTKEMQFDYKNIEFIDIEESKKKKMVIIYTPSSKVRYMLGDKDGILLETLIKKCPDILSVSEFRRKHPEERY